MTLEKVNVSIPKWNYVLHLTEEEFLALKNLADFVWENKGLINTEWDIISFIRRMTK